MIKKKIKKLVKHTQKREKLFKKLKIKILYNKKKLSQKGKRQAEIKMA